MAFDIVALLNLLVIAGYGFIFGVLTMGIMVNPWLKRRIAWQMGNAKKGFAFVVRAGRKAKKIDWDTREPCLDYGSRTYIIDPLDVFDIQGIPCILISEKIGRTIPCENLPSDIEGLYSPQANFSYKTRLHDLFEARAEQNAKKILGMKPEVFFSILGAGVAIGLVLNFVVLQQSGTATAFAQEAAETSKQILQNLIPVIR